MNERGTGLSGLTHSESRGEVVERYNSWVDDYEHDVRSWGYTLPEQLVARLSHAIEAPSGARLLDAGCGTGLVGRALHRAGFTQPIVGVDISEESVRSAAHEQSYAELIVASIADGLPFRSESFAAITCGGVLTYVPDTHSALLEFLRLLRPDGVALVSQRTDLWHERDCDGVVEQLRAQGAHVEVGEPEPYLPGLDEYGDTIKVRIVALRPSR